MIRLRILLVCICINVESFEYYQLFCTEKIFNVFFSRIKKKIYLFLPDQTIQIGCFMHSHRTWTTCYDIWPSSLKSFKTYVADYSWYVLILFTKLGNNLHWDDPEALSGTCKIGLFRWKILIFTGMSIPFFSSSERLKTKNVLYVTLLLKLP